MAKFWERLRVTKDDQPDDDSAGVDSDDIVQAAVAAYHDCLTELEVKPGGKSFTISSIADADGDADMDAGSALFCVYDGNADWYVLVIDDGAAITYAQVVAYYWYVGEYADCFCCSETYVEAITKSHPPTSKEDRHALVKRVVLGEVKRRKAYTVVKSDSEQRYTLGVAYPAGQVDAHGDFTDATELEKAAWGFMRDVLAKGESGVGLDHADGTAGAGDVVESYIYRGPDWTITLEDGSTQVVKAGDWMLGATWSTEGWDSILKGERTGWSIQGLAFRDEDANAPDA